jgi:hypothetical protein
MEAVAPPPAAAITAPPPAAAIAVDPVPLAAFVAAGAAALPAAPTVIAGALVPMGIADMDLEAGVVAVIPAAPDEPAAPFVPAASAVAAAGVVAATEGPLLVSGVGSDPQPDTTNNNATHVEKRFRLMQYSVGPWLL